MRKQVGGYLYVDDVIVTAYSFTYTGIDVSWNALCLLRSFKVKLTADLDEVMCHIEPADAKSLGSQAVRVLSCGAATRHGGVATQGTRQGVTWG